MARDFLDEVNFGKKKADESAAATACSGGFAAGVPCVSTVSVFGVPSYNTELVFGATTGLLPCCKPLPPCCKSALGCCRLVWPPVS